MAGRSTTDSPATFDDEATINPWLQSHWGSGWINLSWVVGSAGSRRLFSESCSLASQVLSGSLA